jgi:hypothetical protein
VDPGIGRLPRVLWSFWIACGLAATGGIAPLLLGIGGPNRLAFVFVPFAVAAIAMAVNALMYQQGKALVTALYFITGLAIVYGMLAAFTLPLRLAVETTCPSPPAACPPGLEQPLSSGEGTGLTVVILFGALTIVTGFFGLLMLYRSRPKLSQPVPAMQPRMAPATEPEPAATVMRAEPPVPAIHAEEPVAALKPEQPVSALKPDPPRESPAPPPA